MLSRLAFATASFALAAAGIAIACSSPEVQPFNPTRAADGGDGGGARPADEVYAETYAEGLCAYYEKCEPYQLRLTGEGAACRATMLTLTTIIARARGRSTDLAQLKACLAKIGTPSCAATNYTVPECDFRGSLRDGESCGYAGQCASGICAFAGGTCGVCSPSATCATGCAFNTACSEDKCVPIGQAGDVCGVCSAGLRCSNGTCLPALGKGADCTASPSDCDYTKGLTCIDQGGGISACQPWLEAQLGQACGDDPAAHTRTYCVQANCGPTGKCEPQIAAGQPVPDGGACAYPYRQVDGICAEPYAACR